jgi:hypothetical protein
MSCWSARLSVRRSSVEIQNMTASVVFLGADHIAIGLNEDSNSRRQYRFMLRRQGARAWICFMYSESPSFLKEIVSSDDTKVNNPVRIKPQDDLIGLASHRQQQSDLVVLCPRPSLHRSRANRPQLLSHY